jgi:hypothetical protein
MVIERERYLDDSAEWLVSLALRSRSGSMHSLLTALSADERTAVADALSRALDAIVPVLRAKLPGTR